MANETINDQSALTAMAADDEIAVWDVSAGAMKKITFTNFFAASVTMGAGTIFSSEKVRARSSAGLRLEDDAGNLGITVRDGGSILLSGSTELAGPAFTAHSGAKTVNIQGSGYDGTRFFLGYVGLGPYWNGTNWRTGTDGGSNGGLMLLAEGSGDELTVYTMPNTGATGQTIAHGSLATYKRLTLNNSAATLTVAVKAGEDTNLASFFGRARIGYDGATSDWATFSHLDFSGGTSFAVAHSNAGATWLNAATGQTVVLAVAGTARVTLNTTQFYPTGDNSVSSGRSGNRWVDVWAVNGTIQTSDDRQKVKVKVSDLGLDFIELLDPISWVWADIDRPDVVETRTDDEGNEYQQIVTAGVKTAHKRPHYGLSAQQVRTVLDTLGIDDFAGYIHDPETDSYALRYNEFLAPVIKAIQELSAQVRALGAK